MVRTQHTMLPHASFEHLESVESCILAQQCLPQCRFQFSEWISLLLIVVDDGSCFLNLLELGTVQQSLQECSFIVQHGRDSSFATFGRQGSTWDVKEMGQVDE